MNGDLQTSSIVASSYARLRGVRLFLYPALHFPSRPYCEVGRLWISLGLDESVLQMPVVDEDNDDLHIAVPGIKMIFRAFKFAAVLVVWSFKEVSTMTCVCPTVRDHDGVQLHHIQIV